MLFQQGAEYISTFTTLLQHYRVLRSTLWQGQALLMQLFYIFLSTFRRDVSSHRLDVVYLRLQNASRNLHGLH